MPSDPPARHHRTPAEPALAPVPPGQRIEVIDVLRGFAIFGILVVNVRLFAEPLYLAYLPDYPWSAPGDRVALAAVAFLAEGKFFTLFSFLFGLGAAIQLERSRRKGVSFASLFAWRMSWLLFIGLAHAFLIWWGDILSAYAVLGFLLLLFRRQEVSALLKWVGALLALPVILYGGYAALISAALRGPAREEVLALLASEEAAMAELAARSYAAYSSSDFGVITVQRAQDVLFYWEGAAFSLPMVFAFFLLGFAAGRRQLFADLPAKRRLARRILAWGLALGVPGSLAYALHRESVYTLPPDGSSFLAFTAHIVGASALCLAYIAGIVVLSEQDAGRRRLRPLAAVGRMALTNYLAQSLIATAIFYGYGLGLYGQVGPLLCLAVVPVILVAQVLWSTWWLHRFRYGPVEWVWRTLTYRRVQPLRQVAQRGDEGAAGP